MDELGITPSQLLAELHSINERLATAENRATAAERRANELQNQLERVATQPAPVFPTTADLEKRPKPRLPELTKWSGKRSDYRAWAIEARNKIEADGNSMGNEKHRLQYLYARMEADGKNLVAVYYDQHKDKPDMQAETFMRYMDTTFIDPNAANRALSRLGDMQQKKDSFATFLPKFEKTLAESLVLEDRARISFLHQSLSDNLRLALTSRDMPDVYDQYVTTVAKVASALEQCNYATRRTHHQPAGTPASTTATALHPDAMDWTQSPVTGAVLKPLTDAERNHLLLRAWPVSSCGLLPHVVHVILCLSARDSLQPFSAQIGRT